MVASMDLQQTKAEITIGISQEQLKQPVTEEHSLEISLKMTKWEDCASALKLSETQIEDIDTENRTPHGKRLAVLRVWQQTYGSTATYEILIDALLKIKMRKMAEFVCSLLKPTPVAISIPPVQKPAANHSPAQTFHTASPQLPPVPHPRHVVDSGTPSPDTPTEFTPSSQFGPAPQPSVHPPLSDKLSSDFQAKGAGLDCQPSFTRQHWKLDTMGLLTGEGTILAILDTGVHSNHLAFRAQNKIIRWKNFLPDQQDDNVTDSDGHGTHCAGIAAGIACDLVDSSAKVVTFPGGVAPDTQLVICRVAQTKNNFNLQAINSALDWLIWLQQQNQCKIDVICMSFGRDHFNQEMEHKIENLIKLGTICVAAAGNDGRKEDIKYPAKINNVLCIGAHDPFENRAPFSPAGREMDFLAPGVNIGSPSISGARDDALTVGEGTSCAAPAVAGLVCLLIQCANLYGSPSNKVIHNTRVIHALLKEMSTSGRHHKTKYGFGALKPQEFEWDELQKYLSKAVKQ